MKKVKSHHRFEYIHHTYTQNISNIQYNVIYNKLTPFLSLARKMGLKSKDGKDMLLYQAVLAFNLFYSNKFSTDKITKLMHKAFEL